MDGTEKRSAAAKNRAHMLAAMGINVWYARAATRSLETDALAGEARTELRVRAATMGADPARSVACDTVDAAPAPATPVAESPLTPPSVALMPVEFFWLKSSAGLLALAAPPDEATLRLCMDILAFVSWRGRQAGLRQEGRLPSGTFRWPQLANSTGTPVGALGALHAKHFGDVHAQWLLSGELAPLLRPWLAELAAPASLTVIDLPNLTELLSRSEARQNLWMTLRNSR